MEFFNELFNLNNAFASGLLLLMAVYWLLVIVGVLGVDVLDFDLDLDAEASLNGWDLAAGSNADSAFPNSDLPGAAGLDAGGSGLMAVLGFFYLGRIPTMILISVFALAFWLISIYLNRWLNPNLELFPILYVLPICMGMAMIATKLVFIPLAPVFDAITGPEVEKSNQLIGQTGEVTTSEVTSRFGQITLQQQGPPIVLNVRCEELDRFRQGDWVTLVSYDRGSDTYTIKPFAEKK